MRFFTLFLAFFVAFTSAKDHKQKPHTTLTTKVVVTRVQGFTATAANLKDPRCKNNADCGSGTCLKGICIDDSASPPAPKKKDGLVTVEDFLPPGEHYRRDSGRKCKTNNDCAKDKERPWCGMQDRCVASRPEGTDCHMDTNCDTGYRCFKARCISNEQHVGRDAPLPARTPAPVKAPEPVESLAPEEGEIVMALGDGYSEPDEFTGQLNVKTRKRMSHIAKSQLLGEADDGSDDKGCASSD
ncbi:hypothetical protein P170DRAFT_479196 [Aspergillus steynii IBT 23096]|uniref:Dickkopf N-terminal cysteine-rich domain-containing protein n=1 Tax=Aspergillus steynii IBT 23096 TaxID=1392250 RepID=A0A2I2G068_9EURO|nr:uncharacterized protein P170DRAFT_479196 [Aspergillus steynii IBT 23096]PLB46282.1 hypothetical protein P170DRAFT_479196 [Aspergillus steynii IBT 23096]